MSEYKIRATVETVIEYLVFADSEEEAREMADDYVPCITEWASTSLGGGYLNIIEEVEETEEC